MRPTGSPAQLLAHDLAPRSQPRADLDRPAADRERLAKGAKGPAPDGARKPAARPPCLAPPLEADQAGWRHPLACSTKPSKAGGVGIQRAARFRGQDLPRSRPAAGLCRHCAPTARCTPLSSRRFISSQIRGNPASQKDLGGGILHVSSSTCPFSRPAAGAACCRNSCSKTYVASVIARNRALNHAWPASADPAPPRSSYFVVYPPPGDTAEHPKRVPVARRTGISLRLASRYARKQELPGCATALIWRDLELRVLPRRSTPSPRLPVELEGPPIRLKDQRMKVPRPDALLSLSAIGASISRERRDRVAASPRSPGPTRVRIGACLQPFARFLRDIATRLPRLQAKHEAWVQLARAHTGKRNGRPPPFPPDRYIADRVGHSPSAAAISRAMDS